MGIPYSSKAIANRFIELSKKEGRSDLSPMKLQKLIYYAHAWFLAFTGKDLIRDEIQAWKFGPVIRDIYDEFKNIGNSNITSFATELSFEDSSLELITPTVDKDDKDTNAIIDEVWRVYKSLTPIQLSNSTHAKGSPWEAVASRYGSELPKNIEIPNSLIKEIFKKRLEKSEVE